MRPSETRELASDPNAVCGDTRSGAPIAAAAVRNPRRLVPAPAADTGSWAAGVFSRMGHLQSRMLGLAPPAARGPRLRRPYHAAPSRQALAGSRQRSRRAGRVWRWSMLSRMRLALVTFSLAVGLAPLATAPRAPAAEQPRSASAAAEAVRPDRMIPLFNGKDLSGWTADVPARDDNPAAPASFVVRTGMLVSLGTPPGHLVTNEAFRDYRLEVEYRFPGKGGNCGVLVHASRPRALYKMFPQSIEVQMQSGDAGDFWCIQENIEVPDMEKRRPREKGAKWGGSEGDARRILNLTDGSEKPLGEWNTMVIEARGRGLRVWVNGDLVNEGTNATADRGKIALQAEGTEVEFRKVEIGPLR